MQVVSGEVSILVFMHELAETAWDTQYHVALASISLEYFHCHGQLQQKYYLLWNVKHYSNSQMRGAHKLLLAIVLA